MEDDRLGELVGQAQALVAAACMPNAASASADEARRGVRRLSQRLKELSLDALEFDFPFAEKYGGSDGAQMWEQERKRFELVAQEVRRMELQLRAVALQRGKIPAAPSHDLSAQLVARPSPSSLSQLQQQNTLQTVDAQSTNGQTTHDSPADLLEKEIVRSLHRTRQVVAAELARSSAVSVTLAQDNRNLTESRKQYGQYSATSDRGKKKLRGVAIREHFDSFVIVSFLVLFFAVCAYVVQQRVRNTWTVKLGTKVAALFGIGRGNGMLGDIPSWEDMEASHVFSEGPIDIVQSKQDGLGSVLGEAESQGTQRADRMEAARDGITHKPDLDARLEDDDMSLISEQDLSTGQGLGAEMSKDGAGSQGDVLHDYRGLEDPEREAGSDQSHLGAEKRDAIDSDPAKVSSMGGTTPGEEYSSDSVSSSGTESDETGIVGVEEDDDEDFGSEGNSISAETFAQLNVGEHVRESSTAWTALDETPTLEDHDSQTASSDDPMCPGEMSDAFMHARTTVLEGHGPEPVASAGSAEWEEQDEPLGHALKDSAQLRDREEDWDDAGIRTTATEAARLSSVVLSLESEMEGGGEDEESVASPVSSQSDASVASAEDVATREDTASTEEANLAAASDATVAVSDRHNDEEDEDDSTQVPEGIPDSEQPSNQASVEKAEASVHDVDANAVRDDAVALDNLNLENRDARGEELPDTAPGVPSASVAGDGEEVFPDSSAEQREFLSDGVKSAVETRDEHAVRSEIGEIEHSEDALVGDEQWQQDEVKEPDEKEDSCAVPDGIAAGAEYFPASSEGPENEEIASSDPQATSVNSASTNEERDVPDEDTLKPHAERTLAPAVQVENGEGAKEQHIPVEDADEGATDTVARDDEEEAGGDENDGDVADKAASVEASASEEQRLDSHASLEPRNGRADVLVLSSPPPVSIDELSEDQHEASDGSYAGYDKNARVRHDNVAIEENARAAEMVRSSGSDQVRNTEIPTSAEAVASVADSLSEEHVVEQPHEGTNLVTDDSEERAISQDALGIDMEAELPARSDEAVPSGPPHSEMASVPSDVKDEL
ncbi:hypothetical protein FVE85_2067 [Porphyridium purpureum]|uniref:Sec20 C-terminal domain-containing protein n=1 Tax=Porphyridium purpureum TaxID=35688 RepID=A0A5J4YYF0_PORPP|nr:hypothetical protein FVE85_2067 [Porphyridium purpureum]|eukprot:POR2102..scf209_3